MGLFRRILARVTSPGKYILSSLRPYWFRSGVLVDENTSMKIAAFNRGLIYISTQVAKLPWELKDANNKVMNGAISDLLNLCPNPEMNAFRWRLTMIQNAIIHGNAYAEIERDTLGRPIALWPLVSQRMMPRRTDSGALVYEYFNPEGGNVYIQPSDIYHLPNFHTKDGIMGQGVVAYAADVLGIQLAADNMASGLFLNSGIPSGVLTHPGRLSPEAYDRLKTSWAEQHGGKKTGSTSILEEGTDYKPTTIDSTALQFLESRQFGVIEIARFLGIPPTKLYDISAATYSNVEQSNLEVATDTLHTWAVNLEMEADVKILNNRYGGKFTEIDLYYIFRGDMETRSNYFKTMFSVGSMTSNEIREKEGMQGYGANGNNYYISTNNFTPVNRIDEVIDAEIEQKKKPNAPAAQPTPAAIPAPEKKPTKEEQALHEAAIRVLLEDK